MIAFVRHHFARNACLVAVVAMAFLVMSCRGPESVAPVESAPGGSPTNVFITDPGDGPPGGDPIAYYDGETLFRALLFAEGPAANAIPSLQDARAMLAPMMTSEQAAAVAQANTYIVQQIHAADPGYFESFGNTMRGEDHLAIQQALEDAASRVHGVVASVVTPQGAPAEPTPEGSGPHQIPIDPEPYPGDPVAYPITDAGDTQFSLASDALENALSDDALTADEVHAAMVAAFGPDYQMDPGAGALGLVWAAAAALIIYLVAWHHVAIAFTIVFWVAYWVWVPRKQTIEAAASPATEEAQSLTSELFVNAIVEAF